MEDSSTPRSEASTPGRRARAFVLARVVSPLVFAVGVAGAGCASAPRATGPDPDTGAVLAPCPPRPNCVSSLEGDVEGFAVTGSVAATRSRLERAIVASGGRLVDDSSVGRLRATWRSRVFGFVDDVELALAADGERFEVRSASRIGYSDLGANGRRIERLRERLDAEPVE